MEHTTNTTDNWQLNNEGIVGKTKLVLSIWASVSVGSTSCFPDELTVISTCEWTHAIQSLLFKVNWTYFWTWQPKGGRKYAGTGQSSECAGSGRLHNGWACPALTSSLRCCGGRVSTWNPGRGPLLLAPSLPRYVSGMENTPSRATSEGTERTQGNKEEVTLWAMKTTFCYFLLISIVLMLTLR